MKTKEKISSRYGKHSVDVRIGNCYRVAKTGNPAKRYFIKPRDGEKEYFEDLVMPRLQILERGAENFEHISAEDVEAELNERSQRNPRRAKWAEMISEDAVSITFSFRGQMFTSQKSVAS
jgi:hypothetical protein